MYCSFPGRFAISRRLACMISALLIGVMFQGCKSAEVVSDWFKGDFAIGIEGAPESATNLYMILGKSEVLNAAAEADGGYLSLIANGALESHIESFEFKRERESTVWHEGAAYLTDPEDVLTKRKRTRNENLMLFRVARNDFKDNALNAIAVVVRFNNEARWQGVVVDMNEFKDKEEVLIVIGEDELKRTLYEDYRDNR